MKLPTVSLKGNQTATHGMLQKELATGSRNLATQNANNLYDYLKSLGNLELFEFGLAKPGIRQLP